MRRWLDAAERWLSGTMAPWVMGAIAALCTWVAWGSLRAVPVYHDEAAYLLQSELFAHGRWAMPAPPVGEFFEQMYVLVAPVWAAKYPPGHALLMAPGQWLGLPGLVPVLLAGAAGALLFLLARRLTTPWVALLAFAFWLGLPAGLFFRASYLSETTTTACWLAAWWGTLEWWRTGRRHWLALVALFVGWGAITRPLTMLVFALPLGIAVLVRAARERRWAQLGWAMAIGLVVLAILPLWSWRTTGTARRTPLGVYTAQYLPFDTPGYRLPDEPAARPLPDDLAREAHFLRAIKRDQVTARVPALLLSRLRPLVLGCFTGWRFLLLPAFLVGLFALGAGPALVGLATAALLVLAYLAQAHTSDWVVYYVETLPVIAFVTAQGTGRIARWLARGRSPSLAVACVALVAFAFLPRAVTGSRRLHLMLAARQAHFRAGVAALPDERVVVFVRYAPTHDPHFALVRNAGDLAAARAWIAHDRGADNVRLLAAAPGRAPWLYDEASDSFQRLAPGAVAERAP